MQPNLINPSPKIYDVKATRKKLPSLPYVPDITDLIDAAEVYDLIRDIKDPEHPYTLEQLNVVQEECIGVEYRGRSATITIKFTPTVPHCSLATLIGLCLRTKLERDLPQKCKIDIFVTPGTHGTENEINKQINDKERIAAALENPYLRPLVEECIKEAEY